MFSGPTPPLGHCKGHLFFFEPTPTSPNYFTQLNPHLLTLIVEAQPVSSPAYAGLRLWHSSGSLVCPFFSLLVPPSPFLPSVRLVGSLFPVAFRIVVFVCVRYTPVLRVHRNLFFFWTDFRQIFLTHKGFFPGRVPILLLL